MFAGAASQAASPGPAGALGLAVRAGAGLRAWACVLLEGRAARAGAAFARVEDGGQAAGASGLAPLWAAGVQRRSELLCRAGLTRRLPCLRGCDGGRSAAAILPAVAPVLAPVLAAIHASRHDGGGAHHGGRPGDWSADDAAPYSSCWSEGHVSLLQSSLLLRPGGTLRSPGWGSGPWRSSGRPPGERPRRTAPPTSSPRQRRRPCCRSPSPRRGAPRPRPPGLRRSLPRVHAAR